MFYPNYKGGNDQKGEFKPISNVLTYRVETAAKPGEPVKVVLVELPKPPPLPPGKPALVLHCGKGAGKQQEELVAPGYAYKLVQGANFEGWGKPAIKPHCWYDAAQVRVEVSVPPGTAGTLKLHFLDGDNLGRKQTLSVQGKKVGDFEGFSGAGKMAEVPIAAEAVKSGRIEVTLQNLNPAANAVVSLVEFVPGQPAAKK